MVYIFVALALFSLLFAIKADTLLGKFNGIMGIFAVLVLFLTYQYFVDLKEKDKENYNTAEELVNQEDCIHSAEMEDCYKKVLFTYKDQPQPIQDKIKMIVEDRLSALKLR